METYDVLLAKLAGSGARYRLLEHPPEGRTEQVSELRGHPVSHAAKCLIVLVKVGKKVSRYVNAVVPGDVRLDLQAVKGLYDGTFVTMAPQDRAEALAGSPTGTILPFSFDPALDLVVDPALLKHPEIFFNAARLDRSLALNTEDYLRLAEPKIHPIGAEGAADPRR